MKKKLISIITPCYNSEKHIEDSIISVQNQTYTNWEHIIVDDCSSDSTIKIVQAYMKNDKRIKFISLSENCGAAVARNKALEHANGKYVAFLDSDDKWLPEKLEKQLEFMRKNNLVFTFTKYEMIDENGSKLDNIVNIPDKMEYRSLLKNTIIGCLTVMLDVEKLKNVRMPNIKPEDTALWLKILKDNHTAYGLQEVLAQYRLVDGSVSSNKFKAAHNLWNVYRKQENLSFFNSLWCISHYAINAIIKHKNIIR